MGIPETDIDARRASVRAAVASARIEGVAVSAEALAIMDRFVSGELDADGMVGEVLERYGAGVLTE